MSHTTTSTGIRITTAADGQRSVAVRTATTVHTGPAFREQLEQACRPPAASTPPAGTAAQPAPGTASPTSASPCTDIAALRDQLRELIQQLLELLERNGGAPAASTGIAPRPTSQGAAGCAAPNSGTAGTAAPTPGTGPASTTPTNTTHATPAQATPTGSRPATPQRVFDVRPAGDPAAASTGKLVVRGGIAGAPVTTGEKLDEGVRRIASFLDQIERHVQAGGTFTDAQLQSIADETLGLYYEAIRPTTGDGDLGDYTPAARDGVLDLGASTRSIIVQATVHAAEPVTPTAAAEPMPATVAEPIAA